MLLFGTWQVIGWGVRLNGVLVGIKGLPGEGQGGSDDEDVLLSIVQDAVLQDSPLLVGNLHLINSEIRVRGGQDGAGARAGNSGGLLPEGFLYDRALGQIGGIRRDLSTTEWETTLLNSEEAVDNVESSGSHSRSLL